jgi:hypothetical protein
MLLLLFYYQSLENLIVCDFSAANGTGKGPEKMLCTSLEKKEYEIIW